MKVLIPSTFTLVSSTVPIDEAPIFINKIYAIGNKVAFNDSLYERLTNIDTFVPFDNKKIYQNGETASFSSINYICNNYLAFSTPTVDTARWSAVTSSAYAYSHAYSVGNIALRDGRYYLCLTAHTSPSIDTITPWVYGKASALYAGGNCSYNGRYYGIKAPFLANTWGANVLPTYLWWWNDITSTMILPTNSTYWADITDHIFLDTTLYTVGTVVNYSGSIYKCNLDSVMPNPNTDTSRWMVSASTLPTNTTDWKNLGALNRFKMFDQYLSTTTESNGNIQVSLTDINFNALYFGNIFADSITIQIINNSNASIVEDVSFDLSYDCVDEFDYFFGDWMDNRIPTLKYERTSVYNDVSIQITLIGQQIKSGIFIIGNSYFIGDEPWGVTIEALDFSTITEDATTGGIYLLKGNELKIKSYDLWVNTNQLLAVDNILQRVRGIPAFFYGKNENTNTYGYLRKKTEVLKNPTKSLVSIDIRELL